MDFITGIGKGIRERNPPYHQAYVFGAELNAVSTDGWYSPLDIWDPTTSFDLSTISKNHEVVIALLNISTTVPVTLSRRFRWYRDRDNALLFDWTYNLPLGWAGIWSAYSYIGWLDREISENGSYHVDITVTGDVSFSYTLHFTVSGIPAVVTPPSPVGNFVDAIFSAVWDAKDYIYVAWSLVKDWVWPFSILSAPIYALYVVVKSLLTPIAHFGDWVSDVATKVANILSGTDITSLLQIWLTYAENAWSWVANAWWNIWSTIVDWWKTVTPIVQGWIDIATQHLPELWVAWSNFWYYTLPTLITSSWLYTWSNSLLNHIQGLIDSAFTTRQSLWSGWQEQRDKVIEFFTDPVEFIWDKFTDWFLGPEE